MAQFTTTQVAEKFDTDARTLRKFLRADARGREVATPGKGARYMIEGKDLRSLQSRFNKWGEAVEAQRAAKADAPAEEALDEVGQEVLDDAHPVEDEGPTDEDLAEVDDLDLDAIED